MPEFTYAHMYQCFLRNPFLKQKASDEAIFGPSTVELLSLFGNKFIQVHSTVWNSSVRCNVCLYRETPRAGWSSNEEGNSGGRDGFLF